MNKMLTIQEAENLIEKYYDGSTSREEEQALHFFLQQENLPEQFTAEAALFGYFAAEKQLLKQTLNTTIPAEESTVCEPVQTQIKTPPKGRKLVFRPLVTWSVAAAAILCGVLIFNNLKQSSPSAIAYVNGVPCTNTSDVKEMALASLQDVGLHNDDVAGTVGHLTDQNMVENQLELISIN